MKKGFTIIELMVCVVMILIVCSLIFGIAAGGKSLFSGGSHITWGMNGITETRCIDGYKFIIGEGGQARQIMDAYGKGVPCQ